VAVPAFYMRRILRIWPLYFAFIALVALVPALNPRHVLGLRYIIRPRACTLMARFLPHALTWTIGWKHILEASSYS
jgi:hypothetical protein